MKQLEQIKNAGIVGCGGAGFPTAVKLNCSVKTLIINAAECEPLLRTDRWLMVHKAQEIIRAIDQVAAMVQAEQAVIALKHTYIDEIQALTQAITSLNSPVSLFRMQNFYPAGDEQIMVCEVTGRTVPPSGIPLDVGAVVSNAATMFHISEAMEDRPFTHKYLTVTGAVTAPCIVHAPLGTSFEECLKAGGGCLEQDYHVIVGGPLMGKLYSMEQARELAVEKTTSGFILVPSASDYVRLNKTPLATMMKQARTSCIQCSYCTQMCPRYLIGHPLQPHLIMRKFAYAGSEDVLRSDETAQQAMICCECGVCEAYACPMGLPPRQINIYIKNLLRKSGFRYQKPERPFAPLAVRSGRRIPSKRIATRAGVDAYYDLRIDRLVEVEPECVKLPLQQHIGTPSVPLVAAGDPVYPGQQIGAMKENSLGANLHASIGGKVLEVSETAIFIQADKKEDVIW